MFYEMRERIPVGLSMPKAFIIRIDEERGDIPRSRYVLGLAEKALRSENSSIKKSLRTASEVGLEEQSAKSSQKHPLWKGVNLVMRNKVSLPDISSDQKVVAVVTFCLTPKHSQCPGFYEDFTGKFRVNCSCQCGHTHNSIIKLINGEP